MPKTPTDLTRNQIAQFAPNHRAIIAIEQLFSQVNTAIPDDIQQLLSLMLAGDAKANIALDAINHIIDAFLLSDKQKDTLEHTLADFVTQNNNTHCCGSNNLQAALLSQPLSTVIGYYFLSVIDTTATITLPTTPTIFVPATYIDGEGMTYDNTTGVITTQYSGVYNYIYLFNGMPTIPNKNIYSYLEESEDGGSTWTIDQYSARENLYLSNTVTKQIMHAENHFHQAGYMIRMYLWGEATCKLYTTDLPGTTAGTVVKPAFKLTISGG